MHEWEKTMREARKAFDGKAYKIAIKLNHQALEIAQLHFVANLKKDTEKAVTAVMVSYFSLADAYLEIRDYDSASQMYQKSLNFIQLINQDAQKTNALEAAIYHATTKLNVEWCLFTKHHLPEANRVNNVLSSDFQLSLTTLITSNSITH